MTARAGASSSSASAGSGVKSHVKVPRLNGAKLGVLATRSPHRPVPLGLSTAQVSADMKPEHRTATVHLLGVLP
jgi:tRNA (Thr-GGU) A37 N-methylase